MSEHHNNGANKSSKLILNSWKSENKWRNKFVSESVNFCMSSVMFPSPDRAFEDTKKKTNILLEFKPQRGETKRGIMTGLGQCIGYLNKAHASILVAPAFIDEKGTKFNMGEFLAETFKKFILNRLPIALFTFDEFDGQTFKNFRLRCNIADSLYGRSKAKFKANKPYWAWWRDWSLDAFYKLLKSTNNVSSENERSEKVWDEFFFKYFAPPETRTSLKPVPSNIIGLDSKKMITAKSKKKEFLKKVEDGKITEEEGIKLLGKEFSKDEKENIYRNYKKNIFIFLDHNFLWDKFQYVTPLGKKLVERVGKYEGDIKKLNDEFAQIILVQGKHQEFIEEIQEISNEFETIDNENIFIEKLEIELEKRGHIAKNPNRIKGEKKSRKFLQAEKQLWGHLNLIEINKKGEQKYFFINKGYKFNHGRIELLKKDFYKNYGKEADKNFL